MHVPPINLSQDLQRFGLAVLYLEGLLYPCDKVVLESSFDQLVKNIR